MVVQTYPSPLPNGAGIRYSESGYTRQNTGGCGFWNKDADWANASALPTINSTVRGAVTASGIANVKILDLTSALNGRRLCENTVGLLEEKGLAFVDQRRCRGQDRVGRPDPHRVDGDEQLLHPGVAAPELLG